MAPARVQGCTTLSKWKPSYDRSVDVIARAWFQQSAPVAGAATAQLQGKSSRAQALKTHPVTLLEEFIGVSGCCRQASCMDQDIIKRLATMSKGLQSFPHNLVLLLRIATSAPRP